MFVGIYTEYKLQQIIDRLIVLRTENSVGLLVINPVLIAELQSAFRDHCLCEEEEMKAIEYPYIHAHILAHTITSKYFIRLINYMDTSPSLYLVSDLIGDILEHVNTYDAQFDEYRRSGKNNVIF